MSALELIVFSLLLGVELLLVNHFVQAEPWLWMILPSLPLLAWFFEDQSRQQSTLMAEAVRGAGSELQLEPLKMVS